MNKKNNYIKQLEQVIGKFLEPLREIPYPIAIKALYGFEVFPFERCDKKNKELIKSLAKAADVSGKKAKRKGIFTNRPNEAGNRIEPFVLEALRKVGLKADKPACKSGRKKTAGYPDIEIKDKYNRTVYLDCKTYNTQTKNQTFRTFYFSPSADPKITKDAFHLIMSFELKIAKRKSKNAFVPISWHIYTLDKLLVQVKHEFNASNKDLYTSEALLVEGKI